jgi:hypothetical protein
MPDLGLLKINQLTNLPKPNTVAVGGLRFCTNNLTDENQGRIQLERGKIIGDAGMVYQHTGMHVAWPAKSSMHG